MDKPEPPPEASLLKEALDRSRLSARKAAQKIGISDTRLRQIVNGYQAVGQQTFLPVVGPPGTIARIAEVLGVSAASLREAGRDDAAAYMIPGPEHPKPHPRLDRIGVAADEMMRWLKMEKDVDDSPPVDFLAWYSDADLVQELLDRLQHRRALIEPELQEALGPGHGEGFYHLRRDDKRFLQGFHEHQHHRLAAANQPEPDSHRQDDEGE